MAFHLSHDMERRFLRIDLNGFWQPEDVVAFQNAAAGVLQRALAAGARPGEGRILVVALNFPVQGKALTEEMSQFIPLYGKLAKRIAVVGSASALQRLQTRRVIGDNAALFRSEAEAEAWLFADDDRRRPD